MQTSPLSSTPNRFAFILLLVGGLIAGAGVAHAQNRLGGHIGVVTPLATFSGGETSTIADNYAVGFPVGVTVLRNDRFAFDMEIVPFIDDHYTTLLFHPGALFALGGGYTFGARAAFEVNQSAYGFTPLLNKAFPLNNGYAGFVELVLPVRFIEQDGATQSAVSLAIHLGVGF